MGHSFFYCIFALAACPSLLFAHIPTLSVEIETKGGVEAQVNYKSIQGKNEWSWHTEISSEDKRPVVIERIHGRIDLGVPIPDGIPYMTGSHIMASEVTDPLFMQRYVTGEEDSLKSSLKYLLFKIGANDYRLVGLSSWDIFLCELYTQDGSIHVKADGENRTLRKDESLPFESIVYLHGDHWQDLLIRYAEIVASAQNARVSSKQWSGWGTWDYYTKYFSYEDVLDNIAGAIEFNEFLENPLRLIQIDGSWWIERGDYFTTNERFPPMQEVMDSIHEAGFIRGMHFDGFRATRNSEIFKAHPDYFVIPADHPDSEIVYFDYSHPGTREYIRNVITHAREQWGVDYFKVDFMTQGMLPEGKSHLPVTRLERFHMGLQVMREAMEDTYFLGCNALFGAVTGYVDGCRTSKDIKPQYLEITQRAAQNASSWFTHNRLYQNDADYHIIRSSEDEDDSISLSPGKHSTLNYNQTELWSNFVVITGSARINSDKLPTLTPPKRALFKRAFESPWLTQYVPIDFWDRYRANNDAPRLYLANNEAGEIVLGVFNWSNEERAMRVSGFSQPAALEEFTTEKSARANNGVFEITLEPYKSYLYRYEGPEHFETLRKSLTLH